MTTTSPQIIARKLARQADADQDAADQYRAMVHAIRTCVKPSGVVDEEVARLEQMADEYDDSADALRGEALLAGYDPDNAWAAV